MSANVSRSHEIVDIDPFDLPECLGTGQVTWVSLDGIHGGHRVAGELVAGELEPVGAAPLACDLLAVDEAYPVPVASEEVRHRTHQAWRHGQIHLVAVDDRLTLLVPGTGFTADLALEAVERLAKALGAQPSDFAVHLRLGR